MRQFYNKVHEIIGKDEFPMDACNSITIWEDSVMIHFDSQQVGKRIITKLFNIKNWEAKYNVEGGYDYFVADGEINGICFDVFLNNIKTNQL
jgi:hypothetical protein